MVFKSSRSPTSSRTVRKRSTRYRRRPRTSYSLAARALRVARAANHKELKRIELQESSAVTNVDYNGIILNVTAAINQGLTDQERVGDKIWLKSVQIKGHANFNNLAAVGVEAQVLRIICFYDKSNKINIPGPGVGGYLSAVGTSIAVDSPKYWDSRFETNLVFDKRMTLSRNGSEAQLMFCSGNVNKPTQFNNATTTATRGALKILLISDQGPAAALPEWSYYLRLTFTDS